MPHVHMVHARASHDSLGFAGAERGCGQHGAPEAFGPNTGAWW